MGSKSFWFFIPDLTLPYLSKHQVLVSDDDNDVYTMIYYLFFLGWSSVALVGLSRKSVFFTMHD